MPTLLGGVASGFPGTQFFIERHNAWDSPIAQALCRQRRQFNFRNIKPSAMFGRAVNLREYTSSASSVAAANAASCFGGIRFQARFKLCFLKPVERA
jgi:hypothetical protein